MRRARQAKQQGLSRSKCEKGKMDVQRLAYWGQKFESHTVSHNVHCHTFLRTPRMLDILCT